MEVVYVVPRPKAVHVVPRRCVGVDVTPYTTYPVDPTKKRKIIITLQEIETRVHLSSQEAALSLGISVTTLKKTCRLLGMPRWPYSRKGKSCSKSYSKRPKNEAPPTYESPLWFPDSWHSGTPPLCSPDADTQSLWFPDSMYPLWHSGTPPLCLDSAPWQDTDEVPDEGCDLWFLACECSPRCGPLCEFTSRPNVDPS